MPKLFLEVSCFKVKGIELSCFKVKGTQIPNFQVGHRYLGYRKRLIGLSNSDPNEIIIICVLIVYNFKGDHTVKLVVNKVYPWELTNLDKGRIKVNKSIKNGKS